MTNEGLFKDGKPLQTNMEWEKALKRMLEYYHYGHGDTEYFEKELHTFIQSLLDEQKKEIREQVKRVGNDHFKKYPELMYTPYDEAIRDVLDSLEEVSK